MQKTYMISEDMTGACLTDAQMEGIAAALTERGYPAEVGEPGVEDREEPIPDKVWFAALDAGVSQLYAEDVALALKEQISTQLAAEQQWVTYESEYGTQPDKSLKAVYCLICIDVEASRYELQLTYFVTHLDRDSGESIDQEFDDVASVVEVYNASPA